MLVNTPYLHGNACHHVLLGGLHRFGVKVAFSIHGRFLLRVGTEASVDVVRWDSASDGTDAGHGDLEQLRIEFLERRRREGSKETDRKTQVNASRIDLGVCWVESHAVGGRALHYIFI